MRSPLEGPRLKVGRAKKHLETLHEGVQVFLQDDAYELRAEVGPPKALILRALKLPPPEFGLLIGDCVQNVRASLDHLAWQLALLTTDEPPLRTEFPIIREEKWFRSGRGGQQKIQALREDHQALIEELQPFGAPGHALWVLQDLAVTDKHRTLHLALLSSPDSMVSYRREGGGSSFTFSMGGGPIEHERVIADLSDALVGPDGQIEVKPQVSVDMAFAEGEGLVGRPVVGTLAWLIAYVERTVLPQFEPAFG